MRIYILSHARADDEYRDHAKHIGSYSTRDKAEDAKRRLSEKPGFKDWPQGFEIDEDQLDLDHWEEGFIYWDEAVPPATETELTTLFERLGAPDPGSWARSQIREGLPQLSRYLFLRQAWRSLVQEGDDTWIEIMMSQPPDGPGGEIVVALKRALDHGVAKKDLTAVARVMQWRALFSFCYLLEDPGVIEPEAEPIDWGLFETTTDGKPLRRIGGLHESVLETDPTGREMRPRSA
jgi:hypothetical protein